MPSWDCDGGNCFDPGTGNGQYLHLSCQSSCIVLSWDCDGQGNIMILVQGMDSILLNSCQSSCIINWDCDNQVIVMTRLEMVCILPIFL